MDSMRPRVVRGDSAVRGRKTMRLCDRCQTSIPADARVCPECGAPLVPGARADIPHDVDRELARANLLRVRGDFDGAETVCLGVLKRYPNSAPTHTLLGDIADDRGNLEEAERWYDLALDLDPESAGDRRKLEDVRSRRNHSDIESTVEQIGLPPPRRVPWFNLGLIGLCVLSISYAAFLGFTKSDRGRPSAPVVTTPVQAPSDAVVTKGPEATPETQTPIKQADPEPRTQPQVAQTAPVPSGAQEDEALRSQIAQRSAAGASLTAVQNDPRAKVVVLTYTLQPNQDHRWAGAELARTAMESDLEIQFVTLRGVREGKLAYMADVPRTRYADTLTDVWQQEHTGSADAFESYVLTNEWTAPPVSTPVTPPGS